MFSRVYRYNCSFVIIRIDVMLALTGRNGLEGFLRKFCQRIVLTLRFWCNHLDIHVCLNIILHKKSFNYFHVYELNTDDALYM